MSDTVTYRHPWIDYDTATTVATETDSRISEINRAIQGLRDKVRQLSGAFQLDSDSLDAFANITRYWAGVKSGADEASETADAPDEPPTFGNEFIDDMIGGDHHA